LSTFADDLTLRDARAAFFAAHEATFGKDGGYGSKWVRIEFWPFPIYLPNMAGRDRAVRLHDLHHIVTGYATDLRGEAEIGAWEVGSGCGDFWHAWVLNMGALGMGLVIAPRRTFRAFVRGRQTDNLYHHCARLEEPMLNQTVGELRRRLRLDEPQRAPAFSDRAAFVLWALLSAALAAGLPPACSRLRRGRGMAGLAGGSLKDAPAPASSHARNRCAATCEPIALAANVIFAFDSSSIAQACPGAARRWAAAASRMAPARPRSHGSPLGPAAWRAIS
jgi:hypothetical protein